jgi:hypothetical protein
VTAEVAVLACGLIIIADLLHFYIYLAHSDSSSNFSERISDNREDRGPLGKSQSGAKESQKNSKPVTQPPAKPPPTGSGTQPKSSSSSQGNPPKK